MPSIIPAFIPRSAAEVGETLARLRFAPRVQIDIVDGHFAAPASWPYSEGAAVAELGELLPAVDVMVDIMADDQLQAAADWLSVGADAIVLHIDHFADRDAILALRQRYSFELYIAGDDELPIEAYEEWLPLADGVQLMGIDEVGSQGQPFSTRVVDNITTLRTRAPRLPIVIDGSVNHETLPALVAAGATDLVVGSAIMKTPDPRAAYRSFVEQLATLHTE